MLACLPCITDEAPEVLDAPVRAQYHPDNMRLRRHCGARRHAGFRHTTSTHIVSISNDGIAVTQSAHSVPPTECADYLAERCRGALERGGVPKRLTRRPSS